MKIRVLGSAAGGGFPQWNCNCRNCAGVRARHPARAGRAPSRRSPSAATSDAAWALVNASPDILAQTAGQPGAAAGARALRDTAIAGIVLVDGQVDHTTGLYMLRESTPPAGRCGAPTARTPI